MRIECICDPGLVMRGCPVCDPPKHVCNMNSPWPVGHPLPPVDPAKLQGPEEGAEVRYRHTRRWGEGSPTRWHEVVLDQPAIVIERSYVWSPGECRHKGGYRHYDWSVIRTTDGRDGKWYTVVVNDTDLHEVES